MFIAVVSLVQDPRRIIHFNLLGYLQSRTGAPLLFVFHVITNFKEYLFVLVCLIILSGLSLVQHLWQVYHTSNVFISHQKNVTLLQVFLIFFLAYLLSPHWDNENNYNSVSQSKLYESLNYVSFVCFLSLDLIGAW